MTDDDDVEAFLNELDIICEGYDPHRYDNFLPVLKEKLERIPPNAINHDRHPLHMLLYRHGHGISLEVVNISSANFLMLST